MAGRTAGDVDAGDEAPPAPRAKVRLRRFALPAGIGLALFCGVVAGFLLATAMNNAGEATSLGVARNYWNELSGANKPDPGAEPAYVEIPPLTTNMRSSAHGRLLQLSLTLRTRKADLPDVKAMEPRIREMVILYLRTLDESDVQGSAALTAFKKELSARVAAVDSRHAISDVFVGQLVLQ